MENITFRVKVFTRQGELYLENGTFGSIEEARKKRDRMKKVPKIIRATITKCTVNTSFEEVE